MIMKIALLFLYASAHAMHEQKKDLLLKFLGLPKIPHVTSLSEHITPETVRQKDPTFGKTPLHFALIWDRQGFLIKKIIKTDSHTCMVPDNEGCLPLHTAAFSGNLQGAKILLDQQINVHASNATGKTAAHHAIFADNEFITVQILELLKKHHANMNVPDNLGFTPLHLAALNEKPFVFQTLINKLDANPFAMDNKQRTPLDIAVQLIYILPPSREKIRQQFLTILKRYYTIKC